MIIDVGRYMIDPNVRLPLVIYASQNDNAKRFLEFAPTEGSFVGNCFLVGLKPSGSAAVLSMTNHGTHATVTLTTDITDEPGDVLCEIMQMSTDGTMRKGTPNFVLRIERAPRD